MQTAARLRPLLAPSFLAALGLLLLNDFVLKAALHNAFTGKLSDFAGLYAFAWVGLCLLPRGHRAWLWAVAIAFALWKSPLSSPLISAWNDVAPFAIGRVVDAGDLLALAVLPLAGWRFKAGERPISLPAPNWLPKAVLGIAVFAFAATSKIEEWTFQADYDLPFGVEEAVRRLNAVNIADDHGNPPISLHAANANKWENESGHRIHLHHGDSQRTVFDTLYASRNDSLVVEQVRGHQEDIVDSVFVNAAGIFRYQFTLVSGVDTVGYHCDRLVACLRLKESKKGCVLTLLQVNAKECNLQRTGDSKGNDADYVRSQFVAAVVNRLR